MPAQRLSKYVNKSRAPSPSSTTAALSHSHRLLPGNLGEGRRQQSGFMMLYPKKCGPWPEAFLSEVVDDVPPQP